MRSSGGIQLGISKIYPKTYYKEEVEEEGMGAYSWVSAAPIWVGHRWTQWLWRASSILWWTQYFGHNILDTIFWTQYLRHTILDTILWTQYFGHNALDTYFGGHNSLDTILWTHNFGGHNTLDTILWTQKFNGHSTSDTTLWWTQYFGHNTFGHNRGHLCRLTLTFNTLRIFCVQRLLLYSFAYVYLPRLTLFFKVLVSAAAWSIHTFVICIELFEVCGVQYELQGKQCTLQCKACCVQCGLQCV